MEKRIAQARYVICVALAILLAIVTAISGRYISPAFADSETDVVTAFENRNVYTDLTKSTLGGSSFDMSDYPHNSHGKPQIISFVEFCYSYYGDNQSHFGLYVYVYNPQDIAIDETGNNKIQLSYGNHADYEKFPLYFLNYSNEPRYEGRFYKFRVNLTYNEKQRILNSVNPDSREYKISGIELTYGGHVTDYPCGSVYTYTGFAKGYGSELSVDDTLTCVVDGFDKYITLDVQSTVWRSQSSAKGKNYRNQLNSVYFSVPDSYFTDYGKLHEIIAEWYEYKTDWVIVTSDSTLYSYMRNNMGRKYYDYDGNGNILRHSRVDSTAPYGLFGWDCITPSNSSSSNLGRFTYGYELDNMNSGTSSWVESPSQAFHYAFFTDKSLTETYIDSDRLSEWIYLYKDEYDVENFLDCKDRQSIPSELFTNDVDIGRTRGYNRVPISSTDSFDLLNYADNHDTWDKIQDFGFWNTILGNVPTDGSIYIDEPIKPLKKSDYGNVDKAYYSNELYIGEHDVDDFYKYVNKSWENKETPVLFRFAVTDYYSAYGTALSRAGSSYDSYNQTLYGAQETVFFDFDIIQLAFRKNGVTTIIPVVASPIDIIGGIDPPPDDPENWIIKILKILLAVIIVVFIILLLAQSGLLALMVKGVVWVITAPFKLIATGIKRISKHKKGR